MKAIYKALILTPLDRTRYRALNPGYLVVSDAGLIEHMSEDDPTKDYPGHPLRDMSNDLICPGFVDTHNHLPQYAFAGIGAFTLLDWLQEYAYPRERLFDDEDLAEKASRIFFSDLIANGTTTTCTFVTCHRRAVDIAFTCARDSGIRAILGLVMMDQNSPEYLTRTVDALVRDAADLAMKWHGRDGRLFYAVTPRFAVCCSKQCLLEAGNLADEMQLYVQTHLAENTEEIAIALQTHSSETYTDIYGEAGLLGPKTILAHCVHLSRGEINQIAHTRSGIAHCPTSNRFLSSGIMPFRHMYARDIHIGLGSDVAAGYTLSMWNEMKEAIENSKYLTYFTDGDSGPPMTIAEAFYMATLGGAHTVSMQDHIGSLDTGKEADFLVVDYKAADPLKASEPSYGSPDEILSRLIYRGHHSLIKEVYIRGKCVKR